MRFLFNFKNRETLEIQLIKGKKIIDKTCLTIGQDFDMVLIKSLDKIVSKNRIERLSLKSMKIRGKMVAQAMSGMILRVVANALNL